MADRVGTYLSDENCRRRCVNQTPPMSKTYGLFVTPGTSISRMPQRPQNPAKLMLQLARAKGVPYAGLKSQYLDALSIVPRQDTMVLGGLNRGMPTPAPSMTPVALANSIASGAIPVAAVPSSSSGQSGTPLKFRRLFSTMAHQPTKSTPIRSRPIIVPKVPDAPLKISDMPGLSKLRPQARVGDSNAEGKLLSRLADLEGKMQQIQAMRSRSSSLSSASSGSSFDREVDRLTEKDASLMTSDERGYRRGTELDQAEARVHSPTDMFGGAGSSSAPYRPTKI